MGTRADFYVGDEWLGSVAWDGYVWDPDNVAETFFDPVLALAKTADSFAMAVREILGEREDATKLQDGWPWPWQDSATTDYAYVFEGDSTITYVFGRDSEGRQRNWPDMTPIQKTTFGKRSGLIIIDG